MATSAIAQSQSGVSKPATGSADFPVEVSGTQFRKGVYQPFTELVDAATALSMAETTGPRGYKINYDDVLRSLFTSSKKEPRELVPGIVYAGAQLDETRIGVFLRDDEKKFTFVTLSEGNDKSVAAILIISESLARNYPDLNRAVKYACYGNSRCSSDIQDANIHRNLTDEKLRQHISRADVLPAALAARTLMLLNAAERLA